MPATNFRQLLDLAILQTVAESYLQQWAEFGGSRSMFEVVFAGSNNLESPELPANPDAWGGATGLTAARACSRFAPPPIG